jgi:hypothetical protein
MLHPFHFELQNLSNESEPHHPDDNPYGPIFISRIDSEPIQANSHEDAAKKIWDHFNDHTGKIILQNDLIIIESSDGIKTSWLANDTQLVLQH